MRRIAEALDRVVALGGRGVFGAEHVGDQQAPARLRHAPHLGEHALGRREVMERRAAGHHVEARVVEWKLARIARFEARVREAAPLRFVARAGEPGLRRVDADRLAAAAREREREEAGAARDVEHALTGLRAGERDQAVERTRILRLGHPGVRIRLPRELLAHPIERGVGHGGRAYPGRRAGACAGGRLSLQFRPMRPRGSTSNPPNRFEALRYVPSAAEAAALAEANPETRLLSDPSRTIVATNNSPDIGFDASVNPYRGCEHACAYCLAPETPVLYGDLTWRPLGEARVGDVLVGFDEYPPRGEQRKLRPARVQRVWASRKATLRLVTEKAEVVTTAEHRWLVGDGRWRRTERLAPGRALLRLPAIAAAEAGAPAATSADWIEAIEPGPVRDVVDIQTSTRTFFAAGLATHNCYARPTHEYLGFSAGLDFETRILVKERRAGAAAPARSPRRAGSRRWWRCRASRIAYQPVERRLELTRRCLDVLAEFRNPVCDRDEERLVTRDADLLAELARFDGGSVGASRSPRSTRSCSRDDGAARVAAERTPRGDRAARGRGRAGGRDRARR